MPLAAAERAISFAIVVADAQIAAAMAVDLATPIASRAGAIIAAEVVVGVKVVVRHAAPPFTRARAARFSKTAATNFGPFWFVTVI